MIDEIVTTKKFDKLSNILFYYQMVVNPPNLCYNFMSRIVRGDYN